MNGIKLWFHVIMSIILMIYFRLNLPVMVVAYKSRIQEYMISQTLNWPLTINIHENDRMVIWVGCWYIFFWFTKPLIFCQSSFLKLGSKHGLNDRRDYVCNRHLYTVEINFTTEFLQQCLIH